MSTNTSSEAWGWVKSYGPHVLIDHDDEWGPVYGPNRDGILIEDTEAAGVTTRNLANGKLVAVIDGKPVDVLCAEFIQVTTEDGLRDGRCGLQVFNDDYACPGHQAELESWRAMSELEKADWELRHDQMA